MAWARHNREQFMEGWASATYERDGWSDAVQQGKCISLEELLKISAEDLEPSLRQQPMEEDDDAPVS